MNVATEICTSFCKDGALIIANERDLTLKHTWMAAEAATESVRRVSFIICHHLVDRHYVCDRIQFHGDITIFNIIGVSDFVIFIKEEFDIKIDQNVEKLKCICCIMTIGNTPASSSRQSTSDAVGSTFAMTSLWEVPSTNDKVKIVKICWN